MQKMSLYRRRVPPRAAEINDDKMRLLKFILSPSLRLSGNLIWSLCLFRQERDYRSTTHAKKKAGIVGGRNNFFWLAGTG